MDLLSILNASDSSEEGGDAANCNNRDHHRHRGGNNMHQRDDDDDSDDDDQDGLDLEAILRQTDDEDDDDDNDMLVMGGALDRLPPSLTYSSSPPSSSWRSKYTSQGAGAAGAARLTTRPNQTRTSGSSNNQRRSLSTSTAASSSSLNPDDWAVLQHILNESDDDDDDEFLTSEEKELDFASVDNNDWMSQSNHTTNSSHSMSSSSRLQKYAMETSNRRHHENVDALLAVRSSSTEEEDDNLMLTMMDVSNNTTGSSANNFNNNQQYLSNKSNNHSTTMELNGGAGGTTASGNIPTQQDLTEQLLLKLQLTTSDEKKVGDPISVFTAPKKKDTAASTSSTSSWQLQQKQQQQQQQQRHHQQQQQKQQGDTSVDDEEIYRKSLAHAQASERKLLKSGAHREIVSPLMVKRRLKPKRELSARFAPPKSTSPQQRSREQRLSSIHASRLYNFSGIVENKAMTGVSASLVKHADPKVARVLCGLPTCLAFNSKFIAVGTQLGIILIFDLFEVLRQRLGANPFDDSTTDHSAGSITSLDLSHNGEAVVAGYTSGILVLWDTIRGVVLRTVSDVHPSPITAVRFLTELKMVTVDAGGLVNKFTFSKNLLWSNYSFDTECLLDGTAGQILAMNVLAPYSTVKPQLRPEFFAKALRNLTLIALSSERSSFAVAVDPAVNVLHRWARPPPDRMTAVAAVDAVSSDQIYLPCLSWGWALTSGGGNHVMPVLARAWGCCLQLLCASFPTLDDTPVRIGEAPVIHWPAFGVHSEIDAKTPIVALEWLNERSLMYLTATHEFTLVDTVMMTLLERLDFSGFHLVYAEFSLSRSASKDSVSSESSVAACTTFQNSTRCSDDRLMVLCQDELRCISIVGAKRRISALESDGEWLEALAFALDHYENTVISQEDRKRDPNAKKDLSKHPGFASAKSDDEEWIAKLLIRYLNLAVENAPESADSTVSPYSSSGGSRIDLAHSHFQMLAGVCVEFCVVTRRLDLLFGPIFRRFQSVGYVAVFLDVLEPYVLNDKLSYIAPEVMSFFVEHCKATNGIATVERCLLHMDCTIMDFDSILSLLRVNGMYSALFYVFNQGLDDYVTPLEILLEKVFSEADAGALSLTRRCDGALQNDFERLGYKAILYLQSCFNGKTFPQEKTLEPEERACSVKIELLQFLTQENFSPSSHIKKHKLVPTVGQRSLPFPYMRILLLVDPRGMLDTLALALDSADTLMLRTRSASDADGWVDGGSASNSKHSPLPDKQEIMVDLATILLPKSSKDQTLQESRVFQSRGAINAFLDFAAKYVMNGAVHVDKTITFMMLTRVANQYAATRDSKERYALQRQAMDILTALPRDSYDPDQVLEVFDRSNMHRAALLLHQQVASSWHEADLDDIDLRSRHFLSAIDCYIGDDDPVFRMEVFKYVKKECSGGVSENTKTHSSSEPTSLREALFARLSALVHLDALMTARLVAELFVDVLDHVINALESKDGGEGQFLFLQAIESGDLVEADPVAGSVLNLTMEHHHQYLALMAKLHPEMVYDYLSTHDNYRTEECLRLCEQYDIADASAYLLERMGNVTSALQLILQTLETRMMALKRTIRGMGVEVIRQQSNRRYAQGRHAGGLSLPTKQEREVEGVRRILVVALDVCERNSGTFSSTASSKDSKFTHGELWFSVLDRLINAKGFLRLSKEQPEHANVMAGVLSELLRLTMQRMVSSVPLSDLVRKVTADHSGSRIGELREMVEGLLATYGFELKVFKGAMTVFQQDARLMRQKQLELQKLGTPVQKVMNTPLEAQGKPFDALNSIPQMLSSQSGILRLSPHGNATFVENDSTHGSRVSARSGLVDAMSRLRSRRGAKNAESRLSHRDAGLNMMTATERMYQAHETEPVVASYRSVGALGSAQHHGRLMSFQ